MFKSALVLAQDMNEGETDVGPRTIIRMEQALLHAHSTGERLVVAAGKDPRRLHQPRLMAEMMRDWLCKNGCDDVVALKNATLFNTEGEITAFFNPENDNLVGERSSIISASWHLIRARDQVKTFFGSDIADGLNWVDVPKNIMTEKDRKLEPLKRRFFLATKWLPPKVRHKVWLAGISSLSLVGINSSY